MILCCRIPEVPIAALVLKHGGVAPDGCGAAPGSTLLGRPVIVGGHPSERKPVRAASAEARSFGVVTGMPLRQAEQLCPQALFFPDDPAAETDLARHLLAGLYALAPRVELDPDGGEAYVDLSGMGEDIQAFAQRVSEYLERRLLSRPLVGIGSNRFVALVAATGGLLPPLVPRGSERSFLAPLPVRELPISPELESRLRLFGLRTLGDFAAMPLGSVEAQFGVEGLNALRLARGEDRRPLVPWEPPLRIEESSRIDPAVDNLEPLLFLVRGMVDRLGDRLMKGGHAATTVRLSLEFEDLETPFEVILRLRAPMSTGDELWTPVSGLLRRQQVNLPVSGLRLRLSGFCPSRSRQLDLLTRRDGRLEDIARQVLMLGDEHGPLLLRLPEVVASPSLLDERRFRWVDPARVLGGNVPGRKVGPRGRR
ncbi:MAG: DNA polymerase Y family protein [Candidatus Dormibacteria bacterium]